MLDLVGDGGLRVSESRGAIYAKRLSEINEQLTRSLEADYKRLTQKAFPTIAGLNLLLRAAALVRIDRTGTHPRMERNEDIVASWHALNSTEQYMSLLEAWLNRADERTIFEKSGTRPMTSLLEILRFIQKIPPTGWDLDDGDRESTLRYGPGSAGLALMWLFGLVDLEERGTEAGEPWTVDRIALPAFGKTLLRRWRMAVPGAAPLDALSTCLLRAAQFDRDHLYCFRYEDPYGHQQRVNDPRGFLDPPFADEVRVGDLPLRPGTELTYRYDFGDRWEFDLTLDAVGPDDVTADEPTILDAEGDPPEQYPHSV